MRNQLQDIRLASHLQTTTSSNFQPVAWMVRHDCVEEPIYSTTAATAVTLTLTMKMKSWATAAVRKLAKLASLDANWDSYKGQQLKKKASENALETIRTLSGEELPVPNVALDSDGTVSMEWCKQDRELDFNINESDFISVLKDDDSDINQESTVKISDRNSLVSLVLWLTSSNNK